MNKYDDAVLGTKWGYTYVANWKLGFTGQHEIKEHSLEKLLEQWQVSKGMLPNLKYYQVHSATFESGILENQEVLNQLYNIKKETGLHIGITTSGKNQKEVLASALKVVQEGHLLFDSFQATYNLFEQSTYDVLKDILKQGKTVIVKEALANGRIFQNKKFSHYNGTYSLLETLSQKYGVGIDAIVLRFVMDSLEPTFVLSGVANIKQLKENLKAQNFELSKEDIHLIKTLQVSPKAYWEERSAMVWN
jgi:aryl-alcohol dehydrogenase-like predicted oxidoreductase